MLWHALSIYLSKRSMNLPQSFCEKRFPGCTMTWQVELFLEVVLYGMLCHISQKVWVVPLQLCWYVEIF